jgi:hypothetical protein
VRAKRLLAGLSLLIIAACASPRERAYKTAVNHYKRNQADVTEFTRANAKQLVAATKAYRASVGRWPRTLIELSDFAFDKHMPLDFSAFNEVTFAVLDDGSVQVHYEVNCNRFKHGEYEFSQAGNVNVKAR